VYELHIRRQVPVRIDGLGVSEEVIRHLVEIEVYDRTVAMSITSSNYMTYDEYDIYSRWQIMTILNRCLSLPMTEEGGLSPLKRVAPMSLQAAKPMT
jgi:hypothetical protein